MANFIGIEIENWSHAGVNRIKSAIAKAKGDQLLADACAVQVNTSRNDGLMQVPIPEWELTWGDAALVTLRDRTGVAKRAAIVMGISRGQSLQNFCQKFEIKQSDY